MQLLNMKYKDFVFPSNPSRLEVINSKNIAQKPLVNGDFNTDELSKEACVIKAQGAFYGADAYSKAQSLARLFEENGAGWLFLPSSRCLRAYFKTLSLSESADKSSISYEISFVEKSSGRSESFPFGYTFAQQNENAFDIAARCGISIEDLMDCNNIQTPFDIEEGDRIWLK